MAHENALAEFLREKSQVTGGSATINWEDRRVEWLRQVELLYKIVAKWLNPLTQEKKIKLTRTSRKVTEDYLGSYDVPVLNLELPAQKVTLLPKGANVIGADGRVDLYGPRDIKTLVVIDGKWRVVDHQKMANFNKASFLRCLKEVME